MSTQKEAQLETQRPISPTRLGCTRFNTSSDHHVSEPKGDPTRAHVKFYTGRDGIDCGWEPAIARLDGSTEHEWVSSAILKRIRNPDIVNISQLETYPGGEEEYKATKAVWIIWHSDKQTFSLKTLFRIVEDAPFDMVIGCTVLSGTNCNIFLESGPSFFLPPHGQ